MGDIHLPNRLHAFLSLFLLLEELTLAGDITAITLGGDVLAHGTDVLAGDDLAADSRLDGDLLKLGGDDILEFGGEGAAAALGLVAVDDAGEGVDRLSVDEHLKLHEAVGAVSGGLVV